MSMGQSEHDNRAHPITDPDITSLSNSVRLSGRQWLLVGLFAVLMVLFVPRLWKQLEILDLETDYRMPYDQSQDYWLFDRFSRLAAERYDTVLVGDSVVWGQYVTRQQTLSHYLNEQRGAEQFANLGLDGAHPAALEGLVEHYAQRIAGKNVIVQCNLLWMSSPRHDLRVKEEFAFNHPRLVPQFVPSIPCYKEQISPRLGIVVEQHVAFNSWTNHLQQAYFGGSDVPSWTMDHPFANPLENVARGLPPSDNLLRHEPIPWTRRGIKKQSFSWVDLEGSIQWRCFRQAVDLLRQRGNRVFVLVGPFNEHMVSDDSLPAYRELTQGIETWLEREMIAHWAPPALPSELYADASHPLSAGYALLALNLSARLPQEFRP